MDQHTAQVTQHWRIDDLCDGALARLAAGIAGEGPLVDGRVVAVAASPARGSARHMAVGVAALPPGLSTPAHAHEAEEAAIVVQGRGWIEVDGQRFVVREGDLVLVPSNRTHVTHADDGSVPLVVLWFYTPAGSELRWLEAQPG